MPHSYIYGSVNEFVELHYTVRDSANYIQWLTQADNANLTSRED